ncbi:hypothetical protein D3C72_1171320 [compost metagenome]
MNAVLPIAGRAAIITKSDFCQPDVTRSKAVKPEGTPVKPSVLSLSFSISITAFLTRSAMFSAFLLKLPSVILKRSPSALSNNSKISVVSS